MTQQNLFETEVSISPMNAFLNKYDIKTHHSKCVDPDLAYMAYWGDLVEWVSDHQPIEASTKNDAIYELVKHYNIGNWKELNWD